MDRFAVSAGNLYRQLQVHHHYLRSRRGDRIVADLSGRLSGIDDFSRVALLYGRTVCFASVKSL